MRKYQQLLLLIISSICVITLLFYRHEYLKLRSVLTVLDFFGGVSSSNISCLVLSVDVKKKLTQRYKYAEPRSVWSNLDNHSIYSSFWESNNKEGIVRSLAVGPESSFYNYKCRVWFEEGDIIVSEQGRFSFDINLRSNVLGAMNFKYSLKCSVRSKPRYGVPYGVLWITPTNLTNLFSPIFHLPAPVTRPVICVLPDYSGTPKTYIMEFVSYYTNIGVKDFIIYDSGIQHSAFPFLETMIGVEELLNSINVMTWNFPLSNSHLEKISLHDDCLSRTFGSAKLVGILDWNEYIMPSRNDLSSLMFTNWIIDLIDLSFETWVCCSDSLDKESVKALPMFLRKTVCKKYGIEKKMFTNLKSHKNVNKKKVHTITPDVAIVRRYTPCNNIIDQSEKVLPVAQSYLSITNHKILRLWKSHLNASSIFT